MYSTTISTGGKSRDQSNASGKCCRDATGTRRVAGTIADETAY